MMPNVMQGSGKTAWPTIVAGLSALVVLLVGIGTMIGRFDGLEKSTTVQFSAIQKALDETNAELREMQNPLRVFTVRDGKRQQREIDGLQEAFILLRADGSRAVPVIESQLMDLQKEISLLQQNWMQCIVSHAEERNARENLESRVHFLEEQGG